MDKQQIIDYIMHTPSNTNPVILLQMLDELAGEGGESSNFSTAEVTLDLTNSQGSYIGLNGAFISEEYGIGVYVEIEEKIVSTVTAVLYEGSSSEIEIDVVEGDTIAVSGDITLDETIATITGNCTITVSDYNK